MAGPSSSNNQNILPVQALFNVDGSFNTFIGQGQPFYASVNPSQSGLHITNSTIDSTPIGATTPSTAAFTSGTVAAVATAPYDLVNKSYVDNFAAGISWKTPANCATTANITLSGLQTIDEYTTLAGDRVLVKNQSTAANNGIYIAAAGAWTRATDASTWLEFEGAVVFVISGTANGGTTYYCSAQPGGTLGTTAINWFNLSISITYTAGTGLTLTGTQFSITNTAVTAGGYGTASSVSTFTVNAQGQLTAASNTPIAIANTQVSGLGTMSTQNANSVAITGGTISGLSSPLGVASGGTGAATLTGYVKGSGTSAFTASSTVPTTDLSGTITNAQLANSTISGVALGGNLFALTIGSGLTGTSYNGSAAVTITNSSPMVYPSAGIPSSTGTGWNSSYSTTGSGTVLALATAATLNNPTISDYLSWTAASAPTYANGRTWYDSGTATLSYYNDATNNIVRVGAQLQQQARNSTGSTITKGSVVYISGSTGQIGNIILAQANAYATSQVIGIAAQDIANNTNGYVVIYGTVENINTAGLTAGQNIYLSPTTAGALTQTEPSAPNYAVHMGVCLYSNANNGKLLIVPQNKSIDTGYIIGQVAIAQGGTNGTATPTAGAVAYGTGTAYAFTGAGTSGQVLTSNGSSAPTWTTPTAYATVTDDTTTNATRYPLFASTTTGNLTTEYVSSTKFQFNPSTGALTATSFTGAGTGLTGTASSLSIGGNAANVTGTIAVVNGGTGVTTLTGLAYGNGTSAFTAATAAQVVAVINTTAVTNATNATNTAIIDDTTTAATVYPTWVTSTTGNLPQKTSSTKLKFNPSTGALTASQLIIAP